MVEPTCQLLNKWRQENVPVKCVCLDNAGENKLLKARTQSKDWKLTLTFEFTARDAPQQNHLTELGFASLANKGRALMARANVPLKVRYKLFKEAFTTATLLDGLMTVEVDGKLATRHQHFCGKNPAFVKDLQIWGEAGTVKIKKTGTPKIADRGTQCVMVGCPADHTSDCYRMWNPITNRIHETRDVIWLKRMCFTKPALEHDILIHTPPPPAAPIIKAGESVTSSGESEEKEDEEAPEESKIVSRSGRQITAPSRLIQEIAEIGASQASQAQRYEIGLTAAEENYYSVMSKQWHGEVAAVGMGTGGGFENTNGLRVMKFKEAMQGQDKKEWEAAVEEEHDRMVHMMAWKPILLGDLPNHAKVLTSTWAMKKKANGTYCARMNAPGHKQVDGEHYDSHSISLPVTNKMTIHIVLTLMIMAGWVGKLLDVKGAFLHGDFEDGEEAYLKIPEGSEKHYDPASYVLLLLKTLYGLKQAARAFWNKLLKAFQNMGFARSKADPCLYWDWTVNGLVIWTSWIDDCLVMGKAEGVKIAKKQMTDQFDCDEVGNMDEHIGCKLVRNFQERWIKFLQPVLLQSFTDEFDLPQEKPPNMPAEGGQILVPCDEKNGLQEEDQAKCRTGVGKLLYMMRWSRPEILNSVRELSKYMKTACLAHMKAMY
jgi:hypothetical protein